MEQLDAARCVVVVWTATSVEREFIWSEVDRVKDRGIVIPVKLDPNARIPLGFDQLQHLDLTTWKGRATKPLATLVDRVGKLIARPTRERRHGSTLATDTWVVSESVRASDQLLRLSGEIGTLAGILTPDASASKDLRRTLIEVHRTYAAVSEAIADFLAPAATSAALDVSAYLRMERGALVASIANDRGHCSRILEYYVRAGGLREWLAPRLGATARLDAVDETFRQLATADGDLFAGLARIGDVLTEEASAIVGLLLAGQQAAARARIIDGRNRLMPLEQSLTSDIKKLREIESSLGYVDGAGKQPRKGAMRRR